MKVATTDELHSISHVRGAQNVEWLRLLQMRLDTLTQIVVLQKQVWYPTGAMAQEWSRHVWLGCCIYAQCTETQFDLKKGACEIKDKQRNGNEFAFENL